MVIRFRSRGLWQRKLLARNRSKLCGRFRVDSMRYAWEGKWMKSGIQVDVF